MSRGFLIACVVVLVPGVVFLGATWRARADAEEQFAQQAALARGVAERMRAEVIIFRERAVPSGVAFADLLRAMELDAPTSAAVVRTAQPVFSLARVRAGNRAAIGRSVTGELRVVRYQVDAERLLWVAREGETFRAELKTIPVTTDVAGVAGEIRDSLWGAVADAGESPELTMRLAEIFGWDLDFYTDPRAGDTFRVAIEKKFYRNGQLAGYGRILAAEYNNSGRGYQAVLFRDPAGRAAYYAPDGKSLKKAFLRSPLKFAAPITSRFSRARFHPILKRSRPHLGVDYGAPAGTPVQAIGAGRVVFAGVNGGSGRMVHIRHANGYETFYLHLSRILVRAGERVEQGKRIGLVGATGLATGPHLDFRIRQHGAFRNFGALRLPPAEPVSTRDWEEFVAARDRTLAMLPQVASTQARNAASPRLDVTHPPAHTSP